MFFLYIFCLVYITQIFDMFYILWATAQCNWIEWTKINIIIIIIIPLLRTIKLQYTRLGDYWECVRPAWLPALTWVPSSVPPGAISKIRSPPGLRRLQQKFVFCPRLHLSFAFWLPTSWVILHISPFLEPLVAFTNTRLLHRVLPISHC